MVRSSILSCNSHERLSSLERLSLNEYACDSPDVHGCKQMKIIEHPQAAREVAMMRDSGVLDNIMLFQRQNSHLDEFNRVMCFTKDPTTRLSALLDNSKEAETINGRWRLTKKELAQLHFIIVRCLWLVIENCIHSIGFETLNYWLAITYRFATGTPQWWARFGMGEIVCYLGSDFRGTREERHNRWITSVYWKMQWCRYSRSVGGSPLFGIWVKRFFCHYFVLA